MRTPDIAESSGPPFPVFKIYPTSNAAIISRALTSTLAGIFISNRIVFSRDRSFGTEPATLFIPAFFIFLFLLPGGRPRLFDFFSASTFLFL
jgi:hypothetical protein